MKSALCPNLGENAGSKLTIDACGHHAHVPTLKTAVATYVAGWNAQVVAQFTLGSDQAYLQVDSSSWNAPNEARQK